MTQWLCSFYLNPKAHIPYLTTPAFSLASVHGKVKAGEENDTPLSSESSGQARVAGRLPSMWRVAHGFCVLLVVGHALVCCPVFPLQLVVVGDVLDMSKLEAGELSLEEEQFDLRGLVNATMTMLAVRAQVKGLGLKWVVDAHVPPRLWGDAVRLRQCLVNLVRTF